MDIFRYFIRKFGWFGLVRLLFYPLTAFLTTPVRLAQTLWNCRVLAGGRWQDYSHFNIFSGLSYLFYGTVATNLYKFGRSGTSPYMGLGNFPMSYFFQYALPSLYCYTRASTITLLFGMFGWSLMHIVWIINVSAYWVLIIILLATFSTTFYANTFSLQNYNVLGWLFFPLGLYGLIAGKWFICALAWFLASFASSTIIFIAAIISVVQAAALSDPGPILALVPAGLKLLTHFLSASEGANFKKQFLIVLNMMKGIGMFRLDVKYKYTYPLKAKIEAVYFLLLYTQYLLASSLILGKFPLLFSIGLLIFVLNATFLRFSDVQSMYMLMFSIATATIIQNRNPWLLFSYLVMISPLPLFISFSGRQKILDIVPILAPFYIKKLEGDMQRFLTPVKSGEKVLFVFDNPREERPRLFDGYRALLELALYVASKREIHVMPDWWGVYELNYCGAPHFWGRDIDSVLKNIKRWQADYVVVYQSAGVGLEPQWERVGFKRLTKFSWVDYQKELRGIKPYKGETPDWWLLKVPIATSA